MERRAAPGWGQIARMGAVTGAQTSVSYAAVFGVYTVTRVGLNVVTAAPADAWATAAALSVTLLYLITVMSLLTAIPAAGLGALTAVLVKLIQRMPVTRRNPRAATNSGRFVALVLWPLLYLGLYALMRQRIAPVYLETFMFWYFMPGLIYLVLTGYAARRLAFG